MPPARPAAHRSPGALLAVGAGGAAGTALRAGLDAVGTGGPLPWSTVVVNLVGAFGLGLLLEVLARGPATSDRRERARLLLGTGFFGGLTTYSAVALQVVTLLPERPLDAVGYGAGLLVLGVVAAAGGAVTGVLVDRRRGARPGAGA